MSIADVIVYGIGILAFWRGCHVAGYASCVFSCWRFFSVYAALQIQPHLAWLLMYYLEIPREISQTLGLVIPFIVLEAYQGYQIFVIAYSYRFQNLGFISNLIGALACTLQVMLMLGIFLCYFERAFSINLEPKTYWFYSNWFVTASTDMVKFVFPRFDFHLYHEF